MLPTMLVGDAGVGKTAIVEALALKLADSRISPSLRNLRIIELSLGALVAGTKLRGEFEERLESIIRECEADSSLVIFIDEIHVILGAGSAGGAMDAANLLKPALARGGVRCIGATTPSEYRQYIEREAALERRFQVVWIEEPSSDVTIQILEELRPWLEEHHHVGIRSEALQKAVELSNRYLPEFRLPDKAIDIIDQACACAGLETLSPVTSTKSTASYVGIEDVAAIIAERCRVPIQRLTISEGQRLLKMEEVLCQRIVGQEHAVSAVAEAIRAARTGIRDPKRPLSVFLFLGPTGVGKTELAKGVAEFLFDDERRLIRFDMSEYSEKHSIAKLIGSPPGYVGHDEGGQLTDRVRSCPHSLVLFDEIEKAHDEVFNLFLQIFDEGRLTDSRGRTTDFRETVVVMTSNLGSRSNRSQGRHPIGFAVDTSAEDPSLRERDLAIYDQRFRLAVEQALPAELRNRIQKQIIFRTLSRAAIEDIMDKIVFRLNSRLLSQGVLVHVDATGKAELMRIGYSEELGARAMERAIHDHIEEPLARMLLESRISNGQHVQVTGSDGVIHFSSV